MDYECMELKCCPAFSYHGAQLLSSETGED